MRLKHLHILKAKGFTPPKDESQLMNGYWDTPIDWIPGMKNIRVRDIANNFRIPGSDDTLLNFTTDAIKRTNDATHIKCNLLEEHNEGLHRLESKEPKSVIYVNFGSIVLMTPQQMVDLAMGLAKSKCYFLRVLRLDAANEDTTTLPRDLGVGLEIDGNVKRDEVERLVRELMEGAVGEMRSKAMDGRRWQKK
ncbi:7-deoxyloganetin glucosyltransferase-like [Eucalyptus grandis]|uniref:7-deoxyloganetin glucosyltransferase-like n=1 Tax=Eucalyptus grandis TaxID=71139 RepID=UPI00192EB938|nr:7-deoxyloganetin glucosyltransferase-like [Eucalyptus grandis]